MSRPTGVTVSAVIAILGSLVTLAFGAVMIFAAIALAGSPELAPPPYTGSVPFFAVLIVEISVAIGLGIFGITSAVGLIRMRNWARICFVVFAILLVFGSASTLLGAVMALIAMPPLISANSDIPSGFLAGTFIAMTIVSLMMAALAIWWLIYFNRRSTKAEFMGEAAAALPRRGPMTITIIGWLLVVSSFWAIPYGLFVSAYPAMAFGTLLFGWAGRGFFIAFGAVGLATGIGLLKWRRWAHSMAIAFYLFAVINVAAALVMGTPYKVQDYMPSPPPGLDQGYLLQVGMIGGLVFSFIPLAFLFAKRKAFLAASETTSPTLV